MEPELLHSGERPTLGYDRAAVEDFLRAASEEREKLQQQIDSSTRRLARARTALGTHRVMVAMLLETQRELSAMRRDAERQAAEIISAAEREVRARGTTNGSAPSADALASSVPIDLRDGAFATTEPPAPTARFDAPWSAMPRQSVLADGSVAGDQGEDSDFFEFLRGALHDDEPLGPRPE